MKALDLLNEAVDPVKTAAAMGKKLKDKFLKDRTVDNDTDVEQFIANVARHIDPTDNHQYTLWILRTYIKNGIRLHEDLDRVSEALTKFHTHKKQMPVKDLGQIKSLSDLEQMVNSADIDLDAKSGKQEKKDASAQAKEESKIFYKGSEGMIVIPETSEASCFWGKGTQWCTASTTSTNYFDSYSNRGDLYIILPNDGTKWQLHPESNEFLDAQDNPFDLGEWSEEYPWAHEALKSEWTGMTTLSSLADTMSPAEFIDEVRNREQSANTPAIVEIDGENQIVILEKWDDMAAFARYESVPNGYEAAAEMDEDDFLTGFADGLETTLAFEETVTSMLSDDDKSAIAKKANDSMSDPTVFDYIVTQPEYVNILGAYVYEKHTKSDSGTTVATKDVENALLTLITHTLDQHTVYFKRKDDGTIYLIMDLDVFVQAMDAEADPDSEYKIYVQNWTDANNESIDEIMKKKDDYLDDEIAIVNKFISGNAGADVILAPEKDTRTKDMFDGDKDNSDTSGKKTVVIPQQVIVHMVDQVKRDLRGFGESDEIARLKRNAGLT
jgi:hypothetical protein